MGHLSNRHLIHYLALTLSESSPTLADLTLLHERTLELEALLEREPRLMQALKNPLVTLKEKEGLTKELSKRLAFPALLDAFLTVLMRQNLGGLLPAVLASFSLCVLERTGTIRARLKTALAPTALEKQKVSAWLGAHTGKKIILEATVEAQLLGGFQLAWEDHLLDGSLASRLHALDQRLKGYTP